MATKTAPQSAQRYKYTPQQTYNMAVDYVNLDMKQKEQAINSAKDANVQAQNQQLKDLSVSKDKQLQEVEDAYKKAKQNVDNDALSRGFARSSFAMNMTDETTAAHNKGVNEANQTYNNAVSKVNENIAAERKKATDSIAAMKSDSVTAARARQQELMQTFGQLDQSAVSLNNSNYWNNKDWNMQNQQFSRQKFENNRNYNLENDRWQTEKKKRKNW